MQFDDLLGCGLNEWRGKATAVAKIDQELPNDDPTPRQRTCPEWIFRQPAIRSIWEYVDAFQRNALGPIWDLPAALHDYLMILDAELKTLQGWLEEKLNAE